MTTQTIAEPGTFTTIGTVTIADTAWTVGIDFYTDDTRIVPGTWSFTTGPEINLVTFGGAADASTTPKSVLAAAPAAILDRHPHQQPESDWRPRTNTDGETVHEALVATIADADGNTSDVYALYYPSLLALPTATEMCMHINTKPRRTLFLPVVDMDHVDLAALFERIRTAPRLLS